MKDKDILRLVKNSDFLMLKVKESLKEEEEEKREDQETVNLKNELDDACSILKDAVIKQITVIEYDNASDWDADSTVRIETDKGSYLATHLVKE